MFDILGIVCIFVKYVIFLYIFQFIRTFWVGLISVAFCLSFLKDLFTYWRESGEKQRERVLSRLPTERGAPRGPWSPDPEITGPPACPFVLLQEKQKNNYSAAFGKKFTKFSGWLSSKFIASYCSTIFQTWGLCGLVGDPRPRGWTVLMFCRSVRTWTDTWTDTWSVRTWTDTCTDTWTLVPLHNHR